MSNPSSHPLQPFN